MVEGEWMGQRDNCATSAEFVAVQVWLVAEDISSFALRRYTFIRPIYFPLK
jgi:hypothetical protein